MRALSSVGSSLGRVVLGVLLAVAICACSDEGVRTPDEVPPELEPLYVMAREYRQEYERGLERIVAGDEVAGRAMLVAATDRIAVAAKLCANTRGCDMALLTTSMTQVAADRTSLLLAEIDAPQGEEITSDPAVASAAPTTVRLGEAELGEMIPLNS